MDEKTPNKMTETETPEVMAEVRSDTAETLELFNSEWNPTESFPDDTAPSETSDAKTAIDKCLGDNPDWSRLFAHNYAILNTHNSERGCIKPNAFKGCKKLKKVVIPMGITICSNAFKGTNEKLTIKFKGEKR